jgi:hypothetical protein
VFDYFAQHRTENEWERGTGHMSDANTLVRDTVLANSNGDTNPVNFSAGTVDIGSDIPSDRQARLTVGSTAPSNPGPSDVWVNTTSGIIFHRVDNAWVELGGGMIGPGLAWKGDWVDSPPYEPFDVVYHAGTASAYVANTGTSNEPPHADWDLLVPGITLASLFAKIDPTAASVASGDITCDLDNGNKLFFTRTMTGDEELQAPANPPDGATFYLLIDPDGNTLSFAAGYEGVANELPDITEETLFAIVVIGSRYLVHVVGYGYGDGS